MGIKYLNNRSNVFLLLYFIVLFFNFFIGDVYFDSLGDVIQEIAILFFTGSLFYYVVSKNNYQLSRVLIYSTLLIVVYYSISSYILDLVNPGLIRSSVGMINEGDFEDLDFFYKSGMVTYQFPHAIPILIPPLMMIIKNKQSSIISRIIMLIALSAIFVIVFISDAATTLFLAVLVFILSIVVNIGPFRTNISRILITCVVVLPILFNSDVILKPVESFLFSTEKSSYVDKMLDIKQTTSSGSSTGSVSARQDKYVISLSEIIQNPLFGVSKDTGGHSAILDRFATLGLVGWLPFLLFIIAQIRFAIKKIPVNYRSYYFLGVLAALVVLSTKNMSNFDTWFMLFSILPLMIWAFSSSSIHTT